MKPNTDFSLLEGLNKEVVVWDIDNKRFILETSSAILMQDKLKGWCDMPTLDFDNKEEKPDFRRLRNKRGVSYWHLSPSGEVMESTDLYTKIDDFNFNIGN